MSPARWGPVVGHPANIIIAAFMFLLFIPLLIVRFIRSNLLRRPNLPIRTQANDFTLLGPVLPIRLFQNTREQYWMCLTSIAGHWQLNGNNVNNVNFCSSISAPFPT